MKTNTPDQKTFGGVHKPPTSMPGSLLVALDGRAIRRSREFMAIRKSDQRALLQKFWYCSVNFP